MLFVKYFERLDVSRFDIKSDYDDSIPVPQADGKPVPRRFRAFLPYLPNWATVPDFHRVWLSGPASSTCVAAALNSAGWWSDSGPLSFQTGHVGEPHPAHAVAVLQPGNRAHGAGERQAADRRGRAAGTLPSLPRALQTQREEQLWRPAPCTARHCDKTWQQSCLPGPFCSCCPRAALISSTLRPAVRLHRGDRHRTHRLWHQAAAGGGGEGLQQRGRRGGALWMRAWL